MGCCGGSIGAIPELPDGGVTGIIKEVGNKFLDIDKEFSDSKLLEEKEDILKKRHEKLMVADLTNEITSLLLIKELNKKDLDIDNKLIKHQLNKMKKMYEVTLEYAQKLQKQLLGELEKKVQNSAGATFIKRQIDRIKKLSPAQFLDSEFAKPLKDFTEKQGLSESVLESYIKKLTEERAERRKIEREEFGIAVNEFPDEELYDALQKDLYKEMMAETAKNFEKELK